MTLHYADLEGDKKVKLTIWVDNVTKKDIENILSNIPMEKDFDIQEIYK